MPTKSEITVSTGAMRNPGEHARHDQLADRIGAERAQRVDLIGDDHRPELGGDAGADAAGTASAPVSTGPSSLIIDALTSRPTTGRAPN